MIFADIFIIFLLAVFAAIASLMVLYFVIRAAVRDGIVAARHVANDEAEEVEGISKIKCPQCGESHDMDYPKCPFCKHRY